MKPQSLYNLAYTRAFCPSSILDCKEYSKLCFFRDYDFQFANLQCEERDTVRLGFQEASFLVSHELLYQAS